MSYGPSSALNQYQKVGASGAAYADPHRLVQMLMEGVLSRVASAKGAQQRRELEQRAAHVNKAVEILGGLRSGLDHERGGEIAGNLDSLYEYMQRQLLNAVIKQQTAPLDEVARLMTEIKGAWDAIGPQVREQAQAAQQQAKGLSVQG